MKRLRFIPTYVQLCAMGHHWDRLNKTWQKVGQGNPQCVLWCVPWMHMLHCDDEKQCVGNHSSHAIHNERNFMETGWKWMQILSREGKREDWWKYDCRDSKAFLFFGLGILGNPSSLSESRFQVKHTQWDHHRGGGKRSMERCTVCCTVCSRDLMKATFFLQLSNQKFNLYCVDILKTKIIKWRDEPS